MKNKIVILSALSFVLINAVSAQNKYFTRDGKVSFVSDAPLEKIEAINNKASSVFDASTGQLEFAVLIKAFEFEKDLMQQHFNENYMESDKYPKAVFKGTISNVSTIDFSKPGNIPVTVAGQLTMHGVTKELTATGTFEISESGLAANSSFKINLDDYNISVPKLVRDKIAREVAIEITAHYKKLEPKM